MKNAIYIDTNVLITLFEGEGSSHDALWKLINLGAGGTAISYFSSALSFTELLAKPYRDRNHVLAQQYLMLARSEDWLGVWPVNPSVIELTAVVRARMKLKLPDAVHVATAILSGCSYLLTFDLGITGFSELQHPISGEAINASVQVIRPDPVSLSELTKAIQ